jgi:hypothetical protein
MTHKGCVGWIGALAAAALMGGACAPAGAPDRTVTVRSALNSDVVVTVLDGAGVPQANVEVYALKTTVARRRRRRRMRAARRRYRCRQTRTVSR